MPLRDRFRPAHDRPGAASALAGPAAAVEPSPASGNLRASNGLKDFLWLVGDVKNGHVLDLGPVSQATVSFFTGRGFKVYTEDLLRGWKEFLAGEEKRLRAAPVAEVEGAPPEEFSKAALAARFVDSSVAYPAGTFHAILLWDLLDYLDAELLPPLVARLHALMQGGGVMLGLFHSRKPDAFHRYRIADTSNIELVPAPAQLPHARQFQNRDLMNLFSAFRSSKTFVGRDQIREALFLK
jgi:hypothetical protein